MGKLIPKSQTYKPTLLLTMYAQRIIVNHCSWGCLIWFLLKKQVINHLYLNESMLLYLCFVMIISYNQSAKKMNSYILLWSIIELKLLN